VTHDLDEAIYLGDRVIGLLPHPGRIGIELQVNLPRPARPAFRPANSRSSCGCGDNCSTSSRRPSSEFG